MKNPHTIALQKFMLYSPEEIRKQYMNGYDYDTKEWKTHTGDCYFKGLHFSEKKVYAINVYTFSASENYQPKYLEITEAFNKLLKKYNILHASILLSQALKQHYRESTLAENIIHFVKYDKEYHLPKFRHHITKHKNRHRKFCEGNPQEHRRVWNKILYQSASQIGSHSTFGSQRNERPSSLFITYTCKAKLHLGKANFQYPKRVSRGRRPTTSNPPKRR